jgi:digeranylgeranylglycerophospholipid reductase
MQELPPCDLLVVGAGPAGSRAAQAAAREGVRTLLIDAKTRIGEQPHCGEFVSEHLFSESGLDRTAVLHRVEFMETRVVVSGDFASQGQGISGKADSGLGKVVPSRGFLIDRVRFDRELARAAAAAGATVLSSTRLVRRIHNGWVMQCGMQERNVYPKFTIAADGACSTVARLLGLPQLTVLRGIQIEAPFSGRTDRTYVFFHPSLHEGYGWVFPKGAVANVGLGVGAGRESSPAQLLAGFTDWLHAMGLIGKGRLAQWGGLIPVSGLQNRLVVGDVLLCGDAAGLTHPITGAGIAQAVFSGELAGRAAAEALRSNSEQPLKDYEDEVRGRFSGVIAHALSKRECMVSHWRDPDFPSLCERTWIGFKGYRIRERSRAGTSE